MLDPHNKSPLPRLCYDPTHLMSFTPEGYSVFLTFLPAFGGHDESWTAC